MTLNRIEAEAQRLLMERRASLDRGAVPPPVAGWSDWESLPEPPGDERRRELAAIDEALGRIAEGSYGSCLACGGPMGLQRLRAIPEARYCVACSGARAAAD